MECNRRGVVLETVLAAWRSEKGATTVEYAFILLLVALVLIAAAQTIGTTTSGFFQGVAPSL